MRKFALITKKERWSTIWFCKITGFALNKPVVWLSVRNVQG